MCNPQDPYADLSKVFPPTEWEQKLEKTRQRVKYLHKRAPSRVDPGTPPPPFRAHGPPFQDPLRHYLFQGKYYNLDLWNTNKYEGVDLNSLSTQELYKLVTLSMAKVELYGKLDVLAMEEQRRRSPVSRALPGTPLGMAAFKRVPRKIRDRYKVYQGDYGEVKTLPWVEPRPAWYQSPTPAAAPCSPSGDAAGQSPQQAWPTVQVEAQISIPSRLRTPRRPRQARQMEDVDAITPCDGDGTTDPLLDEIEATEQVIGDLNCQIEQNEALAQRLRAEIAADKRRAEELARKMGVELTPPGSPSGARASQSLEDDAFEDMPCESEALDALHNIVDRDETLDSDDDTCPDTPPFSLGVTPPRVTCDELSSFRAPSPYRDTYTPPGSPSGARPAPCSPTGDMAPWPTVMVDQMSGLQSPPCDEDDAVDPLLDEIEAIQQGLSPTEPWPTIMVDPQSPPCDEDDAVDPLLDEIEAAEQTVADLNCQMEQNEALAEQMRAEIAADRRRAEELETMMELECGSLPPSPCREEAAPVASSSRGPPRRRLASPAKVRRPPQQIPRWVCCGKKNCACPTRPARFAFSPMQRAAARARGQPLPLPASRRPICGPPRSSSAAKARGSPLPPPASPQAICAPTSPSIAAATPATAPVRKVARRQGQAPRSTPRRPICPPPRRAICPPPGPSGEASTPIRQPISRRETGTPRQPISRRETRTPRAPSPCREEGTSVAAGQGARQQRLASSAKVRRPAQGGPRWVCCEKRNCACPSKPPRFAFTPMQRAAARARGQALPPSAPRRSICAPPRASSAAAGPPRTPSTYVPPAGSAKIPRLRSFQPDMLRAPPDQLECPENISLHAPPAELECSDTIEPCPLSPTPPRRRALHELPAHKLTSPHLSMADAQKRHGAGLRSELYRGPPKSRLAAPSGAAHIPSYSTQRRLTVTPAQEAARRERLSDIACGTARSSGVRQSLTALPAHKVHAPAAPMALASQAFGSGLRESTRTTAAPLSRPTGMANIPTYAARKGIRPPTGPRIPQAPTPCREASSRLTSVPAHKMRAAPESMASAQAAAGRGLRETLHRTAAPLAAPRGAAQIPTYREQRRLTANAPRPPQAPAPCREASSRLTSVPAHKMRAAPESMASAQAAAGRGLRESFHQAAAPLAAPRGAAQIPTYREQRRLTARAPGTSREQCADDAPTTTQSRRQSLTRLPAHKLRDPFQPMASATDILSGGLRPSTRIGPQRNMLGSPTGPCPGTPRGTRAHPYPTPSSPIAFDLPDYLPDCD